MDLIFTPVHQPDCSNDPRGGFCHQLLSVSNATSETWRRNSTLCYECTEKRGKRGDGTGASPSHTASQVAVFSFLHPVLLILVSLYAVLT